MDIAAIIVIAIVTSVFLPLPPQVTVPMQALGGALLLGWAILVALAIARRRGWKGIERLAARLPGRARPLVAGAIDRLAAGLRAFSSPVAAIRVVAFVALFWIVALVGWYLRLSAFGLAGSPVDAGFVILVVGLGVSIPSMPAYVGVLQACIVFALGALGVPASRSFPFAVFIHAVDFAFVGALGLCIMMGKSLTIGKLRAAARPDAAGPEEK